MKVASCHYVKSAQIRSFFGPYFPLFELNTEIYFANLCIQSENKKIRTRKNSVFGHFLQCVQSCSIKIAVYKGTSAQVFSCEFCEILKVFFKITPPVVASANNYFKIRVFHVLSARHGTYKYGTLNRWLAGVRL